MPSAVKDYKLEIEKKTPKDKEIEAKEIPIYFERLELSAEDKQRLQKEIWDEWQIMIEERQSEKLEERWDALDRQYEGKLKEDKRRKFNINRNITKVKVDKIVSLICQAFFKSDPKYSITPRPEFSDNVGMETCEKQSEFLDYKLDNLPFRSPLSKVIHNAVLKDGGVLKVFHCIKQEDRRREERYKGEWIPVLDDKGMPVIDPNTRMPQLENKGLKEFLTNWPDAEKDYPGLVKKLIEGKEISIIATYKDIIYNDPVYQSINPKNFYCRKSVEGYEGLKTTRLTVERRNWTWWELKREEEQNNFYDIEELTYEYDKGIKSDKKKKNFENESFDILEFVYYGKLKEDDQEYTKMVLWFDEESKTNIGAILYPLYSVDCYYIPFYINDKKEGFYKPGVGSDLTDTNLAESAIINLVLESAYAHNVITPIAEEDSDVYNQFLEKRFSSGIPIAAKPGEVDFLQKYMQQIDIGGMLSLSQYLAQIDDDITRVASGMSGRADPLDPTAPASKTIALLQQAGIGIEDYILTIEPSFNEVGYITLQLYFQMSEEGRKFKTRTLGPNPFATISRGELAARTNIQVRASSFDFDKMNEKREDVALFGLLRQEPLIFQNPEAIYTILKNIIKNWSPKWNNTWMQILPPLEEFKRGQAMTAVKAVDTYVRLKTEQAKITGIPPEFKAEELMPMMQEMMQATATPPPEPKK